MLRRRPASLPPTRQRILQGTFSRSTAGCTCKFGHVDIWTFGELDNSIHVGFRSRNVQLSKCPTVQMRDEGGTMAVAEKVKSIIVEQLGVDEEEVTPDASFVDDLGADSLDTVELVMAFEEEFGLEIPDEDAEKITRVKEAVEYIESHAKTKK